MAKTDIKSPFRIIPVHPLEYPLLDIKWDNEYCFDRCLAIGLKSSCALFEKFSLLLEWLATQHLHVSAVVHILDDVLFIVPTKDKCSTDLHNFLAMCKFLGVKKTVPKWRDARIARAHGNILNLTYEYVYRAYEFKWRGRL